MNARIAQILDILTACGIARADAYIPAAPVPGGYVPANGDEVTDPTSPYSAPARTDADGTRHPVIGVYREGHLGPVLDARPLGFQHVTGPTSCYVRTDRLPANFLARVNADVRLINGKALARADARTLLLVSGLNTEAGIDASLDNPADEIGALEPWAPHHGARARKVDILRAYMRGLTAA